MFWEQGACDNMWTLEGGNEEPYYLYFLLDTSRMVKSRERQEMDSEFGQKAWREETAWKTQV
jgi:hypothetical protein